MQKHWRTGFIAICVAFAALFVVGCAMLQSKEAEDEKEVKVKFDQLPAPVKQTFQKESNNAAIAQVDQEQAKDGKAVYEADVTLDGKNWEIKVDQDGKLISKKLDAETKETEKK